MSKEYDLLERVTLFSEKIIDLCKKVPRDIITDPIINQLIRSGTSIGANYNEANGASSKSDFKNRIYICKKEAMETKYWLRLLSKSSNNVLNDCRILWKECHEFTLIFSKITGTMRNKLIK
jgi:four helix bundle protein